MATRNSDSSTAKVGTHVDLEGQLRKELGGKVRDLRVLLSPAGIRLQGKATTYFAKQLAQEILLKLAPQPLVANEIEVS